MNVPNFIEMQNTWCNFWKKFAHLVRNDPAASLSLKRCHPSSVADVFQVCGANIFLFAFHLFAVHFCNSDWLHVSNRGTSVSLLSSILTKILLEG